MTIYKALSMPEQVALQREVEDLRADAERYRWIRANNGIIGSGIQVAILHLKDDRTMWVHCEKGLDDAIDAAKQKSGA